MSEVVLVASIGTGALWAISVLLVAILSLRALRHGAELEAEMTARWFAFRFHLHPRGGNRDLEDGSAAGPR